MYLIIFSKNFRVQFLSLFLCDKSKRRDAANSDEIVPMGRSVSVLVPVNAKD